jgi:RNA polymerase sigma-70 factor (ECF subfamily)
MPALLAGTSALPSTSFQFMDLAALDSAETQRLLDQVGHGEAAALDLLLTRHRPLLCRIIDLRLEKRLRSRFEASDVVQEAMLEAARRIDDYLRRRPMPFGQWLRQTAYQQLLMLRRRHLGADCRTVDREVPLPDGSSAVLARQLLGGERPSQAAAERELAERVRRAMAGLDEEDREVILLRCYEQLCNQEAAQLLGIAPPAASKRLGRALLRLRALVQSAPRLGNGP